jgi:hypothetical protein
MYLGGFLKEIIIHLPCILLLAIAIVEMINAIKEDAQGSCELVFWVGIILTWGALALYLY